MANKVEIFGIKELDDFFRKMKRADQRKVILDSYRVGSKDLISKARELFKQRFTRRTLKSDPNQESQMDIIPKSIGFVAGRNNRKSVFVSAKVGARKFGNYKGFAAHWFDAGTGSRSTKKGKSRGRMPAEHFFSDALGQTEDKLINDSQANMLAALDKLIQRNLKKQAKQ